MFNNNNNIGMYSFCLYPKDYQPSGMNLSKMMMHTWV